MRHLAWADRFADFEDRLKVDVGAFAGNDPFENPVQPGATFAARHAFTARLVGIELHKREGGGGDISRRIHHHDGTGTEHRPGGAGGATFKRNIELVGDEPRGRAAARNERLEFVVVANALAEVVSVDQITERGRAVDDLVDARPLHVT